MDFLALKTHFAPLGRDFLTWLFWRVERGEGRLPELPADTEIWFDDALRLVGEGDRPAASSFSGDPTTMRAELLAALRAGKKIARAKLHLLRPDGDWSFQLDTDDWTVRSMKVPSGAAEGGDEEAVILERMALLEQGEGLLEKLFAAYLEVRTDPKTWRAYGKTLAAFVQQADPA